jgi:hypothetical protein
VRIGPAAAQIARHVFADFVVRPGMAFTDTGDRKTTQIKAIQMKSAPVA